MTTKQEQQQNGQTRLSSVMNRLGLCSACRKLVTILSVTMLAPVAGLLIDQYTFIQTFPYGSFVHVAIVIGVWISVGLVLFGSVSLIAGLIFPGLVLWFEKKSRLRIIGIYGSIIAIGFVAALEMRMIRAFLDYRAGDRIASLYDAIVPGAKSIKEVLQVAKELDSNIRYELAGIHQYDGIAGFPYCGTLQHFATFKYLSYQGRSEVVIQVSDVTALPDVVPERVLLLVNGELIKAKPPIAEEDPQIFKGVLAFGEGIQTFTPCGTDSPMWADLSSLRQADLVNLFKEYSKGPAQKRYSIVSGAVGPQQSCEACQRYPRSFRIFSVTRHDQFSSYICN